ncbi:MAG TPA: DUF4232 domain-containing protein [Solirubrobacteraceae bacterium]|nr:DUF4232 domain-containing protein [Solirubrobacteraceae bacterium]
MTVRRLSGLAPWLSRGLVVGSAVAAAIAALLLAGGPAGAATPATAAAAPACQTQGLVVWINTQGNGTAGTIFYTLNFTNLSGHSCVLRGFPGVSAVNLRGGSIGRAATRDSGQTVRTITLTNGHTAHAVLGLVDIGALPSCPPTTAAGLRVFPPNQKASKVVPFPFPACGRSGGPAFLRIRPVTR